MNDSRALPQPGLIVLFGSGETSPTGRKIFESVFQSLPSAPRLALLETPAGFELNSPQVIGRVGEFFSHRLQNYAPQVEIVPARKRGTPFSPDDPQVVSPLLQADLIFMGPGSPSYAIRQLHDSLAWYYLIARHRLGAILALASAATVAFSNFALPVYEIYKVGEDLHWIDGLDFFKLYGLQLVFIPHWNNQEGGAELDTSRCFMGQQRFARLMEMLPDEITIVGLDEKTALLMDPSTSRCQVRGLGKVTLIHTGHQHYQNWPEASIINEADSRVVIDGELVRIAGQRHGHVHQYCDKQSFPMSEIGPFHAFHPEASLPPAIWLKALQARSQPPSPHQHLPPAEVLRLIQAREAARQKKDWTLADQLRQQVAGMGWEILDTQAGPKSRKMSH
jgi:cyanophycinase-like exopeptidase